jgi:hypothetical protein
MRGRNDRGEGKPGRRRDRPRGRRREEAEWLRGFHVDNFASNPIALAYVTAANGAVMLVRCNGSKL